MSKKQYREKIGELIKYCIGRELRTILVDIKTKEVLNEQDIYEKYRKNFNTYLEYSIWRDKNFI